MFYVDNLNQKEISTQLNLSRPTISRMIARGKELGIISVKINDRYNSDFINLEENLKEVLSLKDVLIVENKEAGNEQKEGFAKKAAEYLSQIVQDNMIIGVSYGEILSNLDNYLLYPNTKNNIFVPLIGDLEEIDLKYQANFNTMKLCEKFKGKKEFCFFPAKVTKSLAEAIRKDYKDFFDLYNKLNVGLFEIKAVYPFDYNSKLKFNDYLDSVNENMIGEILLQKFNAHEQETDENIIGLGIDNLPNLDYTIGLSYGVDKLLSTILSIKQKFINVLIIDHKSAQVLLDFYN